RASSNLQYARRGGGSGLRPEADPFGGAAGFRQTGPGRSAYHGILVATPAVHVGTGVPVTVHTIAADLDRASIRRIRAEAAELEAAFASRAIPYVVPLIDHGRSADGRPFLVTAAYGDPVQATAPLPLEGVRRIAAACGSALHLLHQARL